MSSIVNVQDQPADLCFGRNEVFRGPTAVDFSMLDGPRVPASEKRLMAEWHAKDSAAYQRSLRGNYFR